MIVVERNNPKGIDTVVAKLQSLLNSKLDWDNVLMHDRAYRNLKNGRTIVEVYTGGKEYDSPLIDDNYDGSIFFLDSDEVEINEGLNIQDLSIYFQLNLQELYPNEGQRADEVVHTEIKEILSNYELIKLVKGVKKVYGELFSDRLENHDLQPWHVFRIDLKISYKNEGCSC